MTAIPGVEIQKDANGQLTHVQIDVRQHKEAIPMLEELGLLPQEDVPGKDHSVDEFYSAMVAVINEHYGTNH